MCWRVLPHRTWTAESGPTCQPLRCQPWSPCEGPGSSGSYSCLQPYCWFSARCGWRTQWKSWQGKKQRLRGSLVSTRRKSNENAMLRKSLTQMFQQRSHLSRLQAEIKPQPLRSHGPEAERRRDTEEKRACPSDAPSPERQGGEPPSDPWRGQTVTPHICALGTAHGPRPCSLYPHAPAPTSNTHMHTACPRD